MSDWQHADDNKHLRSVPVHRGRAQFRPRHVIIALAFVLAILAVLCAVIWNEKGSAQSAADAASVRSTVSPAARPTTKVGTPVPQPKPVETSPPLAVAVSDGTWLIGKEIKRGTYRTPGASSSCYWAVRAKPIVAFESTIASTFGRRGAQTVALGPKAAAFITYGCGVWELIP